MNLTFKFNPDSVEMNQHAKYLGQRLFHLNVNCTDTQTHAHRTDCSTGPLHCSHRYEIYQVAKVMVATARMAAEYGSFNCIRQVAPICTSWFFGLTRVSPKRHLDQFSSFVGLTSVTNTYTPTDRQTDIHTGKQTDHAGCYICSNSRHPALLAAWLCASCHQNCVSKKYTTQPPTILLK